MSRSGKRAIASLDGDNIAEVTEFGYLATIFTTHHKVHDGELFGVSDYVSSFTGNTSKYWLVVAPADKDVHFRFYFQGRTSEWAARLFRFPTITDNGTPATVEQFNFTSDSTSVVEVYADPTVGDEGDQKFIMYGTTALNFPGLSSDDMLEFVLKAGESYLLKVSNGTATARPASMNMIFYEEDAQ
jgi:hypothetical protein